MGDGDLALELQKGVTHTKEAHDKPPQLGLIMKAMQLFSHRRPSSGIHLLSDPFPERLNNARNMFARAVTLSSQREYIAASRRLPAVTSLGRK